MSAVLMNTKERTIYTYQLGQMVESLINIKINALKKNFTFENRKLVSFMSKKKKSCNGDKVGVLGIDNWYSLFI